MPSQVKIKEIAFVLHPVADIARARAFYETLLGLRVGREIQFSPGLWWIEYDVAGVALAVSNAVPPSAAGSGSLALEVASLDETLGAVRDAGIQLTIEPQDFPRCRMFAINAPDGHSIMFHQLKA
ncbi:MAG: VOC family protein [Opitutaceae bacterium]|jgi:catechol 2,3-dioxygenase-like lactoylglutathione lyase family enzyme